MRPHVSLQLPIGLSDVFATFNAALVLRAVGMGLFVLFQLIYIGRFEVAPFVPTLILHLIHMLQRVHFHKHNGIRHIVAALEAAFESFLLVMRLRV